MARGVFDALQWAWASVTKSVSAGSLDTEHRDSTELIGPGDQLGVSVRCGRDGELAETSAEPVKRYCDMFVLVGVDTDDDVAAAERDA